MSNRQSPVWWARWGVASRAVAAAWRPRGTPVLVISLPRSGSSWVGETLGNATDALYLREPLSQGDPRFRELGTVFPLEADDVERAYARLADKAFLGLPDFDYLIVNFPHQWRLKWRRPRRVVIKEVNPLALPWFLERYQPRVVHLVRHPAAVALSYQKHGWIEPTVEAWHAHGEHQAEVLRHSMETLATYDSAYTLTYRGLCYDPYGKFTELFDFAGLRWDDWSREYVSSRINGERGDDLWATTRDTRAMADAWRKKVNPRLVEALWKGFVTQRLPWFQQEKDWELDEL